MFTKLPLYCCMAFCMMPRWGAAFWSANYFADRVIVNIDSPYVAEIRELALM